MKTGFRLLRPILAAFAVWLALAATPALAQWRVTQGIDISTGSASLLLIGTLDERTSFYAHCIGGQTNLFIEAFDGKDEELQLSGLVDVGLTLDGDNGTLWWTAGQQSRRPGYLTTDWTDASVTVRAIRDIMAAQNTITFSIYTPVVRTMTDWTVSARGSTAAGREFLTLCEAQAPGTTPQPPPQPQEAPPQPQEAPPQPQEAPPADPAPLAPPPLETQPVVPVPLEPVTVEGGWSFVPSAQPQLLSPSSDGMQLIITCIRTGTALMSVESTDLEGFPTIRSSRDGLVIVAFDEIEPLIIPVGPGPARRGVLSVVSNDPDAAELIVGLVIEPSLQTMALLVANVDRSVNKVTEMTMSGAAAAATALIVACSE